MITLIVLLLMFGPSLLAYAYAYAVPYFAGTIPAAHRQDSIDRWYSERYGEDIPLASWEDPNHPMYDMLDRELAAKPDQRLVEAKASRDALLSEGRWAEAVEATDKIIAMIEYPELTTDNAVAVRQRRAAKVARDDIRQSYAKGQAKMSKILVLEDGVRYDQLHKVKRTVSDGVDYTVWESGL